MKTDRFTVYSSENPISRQRRYYVQDNGTTILQFLYEKDCENVCSVLNDFNKELEEVKKENMEYYNLINCGNCKHHNYDWYDDGDEFEVCDKGNHERLMYNKFCEEWEEL